MRFFNINLVQLISIYLVYYTVSKLELQTLSKNQLVSNKLSVKNIIRV